MVKIGKLKPREMALTPRGHRIVVLSQSERTTEVEVIKTGKRLDIPNSQPVTRVSRN